MGSNNVIEILDDNRDGDEEEEKEYLENSYDISDNEESINDDYPEYSDNEEYTEGNEFSDNEEDIDDDDN